MRISLLLQREPFGSILERTLSGFWGELYGRAFSVRWRAGRPDPRVRGSQTEQTWLANIYLNAIFTADANPAVFDPIRREFSRNATWWKRPAQRMYVALALSSWCGPWAAQASMAVAPDVPGARDQLVVAGNHKIRLLDLGTGLAYGVLKDGFRPDFLQRELRVRQEAAKLGVPVPELVSIGHSQTWFSERYVSGTPINRLADRSAAARAVKVAAEALGRLTDQTRQKELLDEYVGRLWSRIESLLEASHVLSEKERIALHRHRDCLVRDINAVRSAADGCVTTALTHGDFQPANILVNDKGVWLIDWEYAERRQVDYDGLVLGLSARSPVGLAKRLGTFVADGLTDDTPFGVGPGPGAALKTPSSRRLHANLFLMEEMALHLDENDQPPIVRAGQVLRIMQAEVARWLGSVSAT